MLGVRIGPYVMTDKDDDNAKHSPKKCPKDTNKCAAGLALFFRNYGRVNGFKDVLGPDFGEHHGLGLRLDKFKEHGLQIG